ncbi:hypothetical protein GGR51DRAFT_531647 [Nemania sp. FL0031]|nr:hypothetical protein GGR51DRAFT_531647 [Nemania sp. FL0031]
MASDVTKSADPVYTPYPYRVGQSLTLADPDGVEFSVEITHEYPFTISPAVAVNLYIDGVVYEAVLKLYDRRFGEIRQRWEFDGTRRPQPHTKESEAAFQDFARTEMLVPILNRLQHADLMWDLYRCEQTPSEDEDEEMKPERERLAEEEIEFYYQMRKRYIREVRVYDKLKWLQGRGIPHLFTTVTLQMPSAPSDIESSYFQIPGILIEKIDGFSLIDLVTEIPEGPPNLWDEIVQEATNLAVKINRAGVLDGDSQPRNVLVTGGMGNNYEVCRIDFGEANIESDWRYHREDEPDYFKQCAETCSNPSAIGAVMAAKVKRLTRVKLDIWFDEIFPGIGGLPV